MSWDKIPCIILFKIFLKSLCIICSRVHYIHKTHHCSFITTPDCSIRVTQEYLTALHYANAYSGIITAALYRPNWYPAYTDIIVSLANPV